MIYTREDIELISKILYSGILQDNNKSIGNIFEFVKEIEFKCNESCDSDTEKIFRNFVKCGNIAALKKYMHYKKESEISDILQYCQSEDFLINILAKQLRYNHCGSKSDKKCFEWQLEKLYNGERLVDIKNEWERLNSNSESIEEILSKEDFNSINLLGGD